MNEKDFAEKRMCVRKLFWEEEALKTKLNQLLSELQEECPHERVAEAPCQPRIPFLSGEAPKRICLDCALEETGKGWSTKVGSSWSKLTAEPLRTVAHTELERLRRLKPLSIGARIQQLRPASVRIE